MCRFASVIGLTLFLANSASAQVVGTYDFTGQPGNQTATSVTSFTSGWTLGNITRGSGLTAVALSDSLNSKAWALTTSNASYLQFQVTAPGAGTWDLVGFRFGYTIKGPWQSNPQFLVRNVGSPNVDSSTITNLSGTNQDLTVNFSRTGLTGTQTFRLFFFGNSTGNNGEAALTNGSFGGFQVLATSGVQPVPEPGTMILTGLALAGMGGAAWRRRRKPQQPEETPATV